MNEQVNEMSEHVIGMNKQVIALTEHVNEQVIAVSEHVIGMNKQVIALTEHVNEQVIALSEHAPVILNNEQNIEY